MNYNLILDEIKSQNIHWNDNFSTFGHHQFHRSLYNELVDYLPKKQILSVIGLRRTGKTTLLKQIIEHLIFKEKIDAKNILFISFDEAIVTGELPLSKYFDIFLEKYSSPEKLRYIFLDEIQYIDKWQHILKRYYDTRPNIKFIISGSSSLFIRKKTTESLAGRIYEFQLNHLSFGEYLAMSKIEKNVLDGHRELSIGSLDDIKHKEIDYGVFLTQYGGKLENLFEKYLLHYQFPEMINETNQGIISRYITVAIYKKSIEYDIPRLFDVDKVDELKFLFKILVNETGNMIEYTNIAAEAGIELNTLKKYLNYLNESLLLNVIYNYSKSFRKSKRLQKKGYVASTNFFAAFHPRLFEYQATARQYMGNLVETYIYNILKEKYEYISFYKKGEQEIDFICNDDSLNKKMSKLIEVKYVNNLAKENFSFLENTAKNTFRSNFYYIFSKNHYSKNKGRLIIPCFLIK